MTQYRGAWFTGLAILLLGALAPGVALAQRITSDGSLHTQVTQAGQSYTITAGTLAGSNLFHSFGIFGLGTGDTATFSNTLASPTPVSNVIGRVTGGKPSSIDGTIKTDPATLNGANLYLINPFGMVFGPNATVNVTGSFHASTADYIRASDGTFQVTHPTGSTFKAAPAAFGFLNATPGAITVNGSQLGVTAPAATLGLVGGPVTISGGAKLSAPAGKIHIAAVAGPGEIPVEPTDSAGVTVTNWAPVGITGGSLLSVSDQTNHGSGGGIFIHAGSLTISASELDGDNYGTKSGGELALDASGLVDLSNLAYVHAIAQSSGPGAPIAIGAGALTVESGAAVWSGTNASGSGGPLNLSVSGGLTVSTGGRVVSDTEGTGSGGAITASAGSVTIDGSGAPKGAQTGIISQTNGSAAAATVSVTTSGVLSINGDPTATSFCDCTVIGSQSSVSGATGNIAVSAQRIAITNGGAIATDSFAGDAGSVTVSAAQTISLVGGGIGSHISADDGGGAAGTVIVNSGGNLTISAASHISADTLGNGNAGTVQIKSGGDLALSASYVSADSYSGVDAGIVAVSVGGNLTLAQASHLSTDAFSTGNAGTMTVSVTGDLSLSGATTFVGSYISAQTFTGGAGGSVSATVGGNLALTDGASVSVDTFSGGPAGSVTVNVTGSVALAVASSISADTFSGGKAGTVTVSAGGDLTLSDVRQSLGSQISADSFAVQGFSNDAGTVAVSVGGNLAVSLGSFISADALTPTQCFTPGCHPPPPGLGNGGTVQVTVNGDATLSSGSYISADSLFSGTAGSVSLITQNLTLAGALFGLPSYVSADSLEGGTAGAVMVTANGRLALSDGASISADAQNSIGDGGTVRAIVRGDAVLSGGSFLSADSFHGGSPGSVSLTVQNLTLSGALSGTPSHVSADSFEGGNAGSVVLTVNGSLSLLGGTSFGQPIGNYITADALGTKGIGTKVQPNGGTVDATILGNAVLSNGSHFSADSFQSGTAGTLAIGVSGDLTLATAAYISADSLSGGNAGTVMVAVGGNLALSDVSQSGSYISADSLNGGKAGTVTVSAGGNLSLADRSYISADDLLFSSGNAGDVTVTVGGNLSLSNLASISTETDGVFNAGKVVVAVAGTATLDRSNISSDSLGGSGNGGSVNLTAGALTITNDSFVSSSTSGAGNGGDVVVSAPNFTLADGGVIFADTLGSGKGGNITVQSASGGAGALTIDGALIFGLPPTGILARARSGSTGDAGTITVQADALSIVNGGVISTNTEGSGNAGQVVINAGAVSLASGGTISSDTLGAGSGNAGQVVVDATGALSLDGAATAISSKSTTDVNGSQSNGNAGTVTLAAGALSLGNGAAISTSTGGKGTGGDVILTAGSLTMGGGADIVSSSSGAGKGGDVTLTLAGAVLLNDPGTQIGAGSTGTGDAGSITIAARDLRMNNHAAITTASATANGGNITLHIADLMFLTDSKITTSVAKGFGNGGNITIDPIILVLLRSEIIAQAQQGNGGNITILADEFLQSPDSIVSASSQLGISGTIDIVGPRTDLNGSLAVLSSELRSAAEVLRNSCAARSALPRSSLTEAGRGGLPQDPETTIPALYLAGRDADLSGATGAVAVPASAPRRSELHMTMHCGA